MTKEEIKKTILDSWHYIGEYSSLNRYDFGEKYLLKIIKLRRKGMITAKQYNQYYQVLKENFLF